MNPSLLFRREINRHGVLLPLFVVFRVQENGPSGGRTKGLNREQPVGGSG